MCTYGHFDDAGSTVDECHVNKKSLKDFNLWHSRLGHASNYVVKHIDCLSLSNHNEIMYYVCPLVKQTRIPFGNSNNESLDVFELIHIDIWGPYKELSLTGASYFLTIVDDFSRFT